MTRSDPAPRFALDALRAGAALVVVLSHARDMLVEDAAAAPPATVAARAFVAVSGLGHQAVIVFFVLSGYLVTAATLRLHAAGRWSLPAFALLRLTRLWIVLVPCLALGAGLDALGLALRGPTAAALPYGVPPIGGPILAPALGPGVALGNLVFLQTVAVPVFGSNGALWSLSNEAWYYALAGLAFAAWQGRHTPAAAVLPAIAAVAIALALPAPILWLAPVWAMGAAVALLPPPTASHACRRTMGIAVACVAIVAASRLRLGPSLLGLDLLLGAAMALLIRHLAILPNASRGSVSGAISGLSRISYSLYLSHTPVMALFTAAVIGASRWPLGLAAYGLVSVAIMLALAVGAGVWWACERHTDRCRRALMLWWAERAAPTPFAPLVDGRTS